jgi:hypothetical protein
MGHLNRVCGCSIAGSSYLKIYGKLELSSSCFLTRRGHVVPNCRKCFRVVRTLSGETSREPPTAGFGHRGEGKKGLRFTWHCAALYAGGRVIALYMTLCRTVRGRQHNMILFCCRLLLCSCRRHFASGAPVHHQELLCILFQRLWICYQGKKQI